jgi:hypothetical protein
MDDEPKVLTPQEKKALSYAKDRRNTYGENAKASRKSIPLSKARAQRAVRRSDKVAIEASVEDVALTRPKPKWKKTPDKPLGEVVKGKLAWRARTDGKE